MMPCPKCGNDKSEIMHDSVGSRSTCTACGASWQETPRSLACTFCGTRTVIEHDSQRGALTAVCLACHARMPITGVDVGSPALPQLEPRANALHEAARLITGDRNITYGTPTQNFTDIASMWTVQLAPKLRDGAVVTASDVAWLMILLKACRAKTHPQRDNWVDAAGYAGCGYEVENPS